MGNSHAVIWGNGTRSTGVPRITIPTKKKKKKKQSVGIGVKRATICNASPMRKRDKFVNSGGDFG